MRVVGRWTCPIRLFRPTGPAIMLGAVLRCVGRCFQVSWGMLCRRIMAWSISCCFPVCLLQITPVLPTQGASTLPFRSSPTVDSADRTIAASPSKTFQLNWNDQNACCTFPWRNKLEQLFHHRKDQVRLMGLYPMSMYSALAVIPKALRHSKGMGPSNIVQVPSIDAYAHMAHCDQSSYTIPTTMYLVIAICSLQLYSGTNNTPYYHC